MLAMWSLNCLCLAEEASSAVSFGNTFQFLSGRPPIVPSPGEWSKSVVCNIATALILELFAGDFLINLHWSSGLPLGLLEKLRGCSQLHRQPRISSVLLEAQII
jgi:hypothetical protein